MGGLVWEALPLIAESLGIKDIDGLIDDLVTIREWQNRSATDG